jgi:hypothetical protein
MPYKFEYVINDDQPYTDFSFTDGNPRKHYILTRERENGQERWWGTIMTSQFDDGDFNEDENMTKSLVTELRGLLPATE